MYLQAALFCRNKITLYSIYAVPEALQVATQGGSEDKNEGDSQTCETPACGPQLFGTRKPEGYGKNGSWYANRILTTLQDIQNYIFIDTLDLDLN
jgi:hypothetical protein